MYIYSLIVNVCRRPRSSLPVRYVNHTILGNKHLFQNGRALLKCRSFILLQLVIPTLKSHAARRHVTTRTCHCEQTFQDGPRIFSSLLVIAFRFSCLLCCCRSSTPHCPKILEIKITLLKPKLYKM
jgi:hypothetical protein